MPALTFVLNFHVQPQTQTHHHTTLTLTPQAKTRKLKQLWSKFRAAKLEIDDLKEEFAQEKEDLLHSVRELTRQVQLQNLVIDSFVPQEEVEGAKLSSSP